MLESMLCSSSHAKVRPRPSASVHHQSMPNQTSHFVSPGMNILIKSASPDAMSGDQKTDDSTAVILVS